MVLPVGARSRPARFVTRATTDTAPPTPSMGIDRTELDDEDGWWETFTGADLGAEKLREIEALWRD